MKFPGSILKCITSTSISIIIVLLSPICNAQQSPELNFTGELKAINFDQFNTKDTISHVPTQKDILLDNTLSLRLIFESSFKSRYNFNFHLNNFIQQNNTATSNTDVHPFRIKSLQKTYIDRTDNNYNYQLRQEIDRAKFSLSWHKMDVHIGRQAISWGVGRFWQPLDIFGAFSATTLDREFKPGVDLVNIQYFPSDFSQLTFVYAFANDAVTDSKLNIALYYQQKVGMVSNMSLLAGYVIKNPVFGFSYETEWHGAALRTEAISIKLDENQQWNFYAIAGMDYQFKNELLTSIEFYHYSNGANSIKELATMSENKLLQLGLQKHLSQNLLGLNLQKPLTPLLEANYLLLTAVLSKENYQLSTLHQISATYSLSDESDLLLAIIKTTGGKLDNSGSATSEFGHIANSLLLRYRLFF